ncbi:cytochrome c [Puniceibacterium sp. IMCC21224]|uniref:c-type cytochrome n=1 Tax=Puniceibacterium sp. IMCC21224 TaxID=1618204 RepID=UPI00064E090D|nr:cytochrome c [Puniceibacterium sp. IMCC21224]KMK66949.1 cytochrome c, mono- and diheme variants family [Puniceibacterium sp. IMCC21224]
MRRVLVAVLLAGVCALGVGLWLTRANPVSDAVYSGLRGDADRGDQIFVAAGCASCHHAPDAPEDAANPLSGGQRFASDFGTFIAPNISSDREHGIGGWSLTQFASAVTRGVSPEGAHYYPAFPYTAYIHMTPQDVADLWAHLQTLPADATPSQPHQVGFPFNIRRSVGGWKVLYLTDDWVMPNSDDPMLTRGRYLVEALAHCGECHTPRDALGGLQKDAWLTGAPNPTGEGRIPALTPDKLTWSATDIAYYLETGFTPDFDSVGGHMVAVVNNFAKLPTEDRAAVATYIKALSADSD